MTSQDNSIAIIGMSCRFPGANNPEEFWEVLSKGIDVTTEVPKSRHCYEQLKTHIKRGGFLKCPVDDMDSNFFGIPGKEAQFIDPQQRLLLEVTWEALEKSHINPLTLKGTKTGVFVGVWSNDYENVMQSVPARETCEFHLGYLGNSLGGSAARISYFLGLHGPHGSVDAGCASSLYSLHQACQSLRNLETNLCIATGVNLILYPVIGKLSSMVFAPDGRCKTFDTKADGYGRAEGCAALILKRLPDAVRDRNKILAVIRGIAVNSDASSTSFGTPCKLAQKKAIRDALKDANISPDQVSYIEAHGTGTEIGDHVEMAALASAYSNRNRIQPLIVGSVKTNMGHAEAAAGLAGIIKVVLSLQNEVIPPHLNFNQLSSHVNLKAVPARVPVSREKWTEKCKIAGVSAFALGGQNAHVILEESPCKKMENNITSNAMKERPLNILTFSAKCEKALDDTLHSFKNLLESSDENLIEDICFTANNTKAVFPHRVAVMGKDRKEIKENLQQQNYLISRGKISQQKSKVAFIFSEDMQNLEFSKILYETNLIYKETVDRCNNMYLNNTGKSMLAENGENNCLPLIFSTQYSLFKIWESFGVKPDCVLGCGVGEFAAAAAAGILSVEDSLKILMRLQTHIENIPKVDTLTARTNIDTMKLLVQEYPDINIIAVNSVEEVLISGEESAIAKFADFCVTKDVPTYENSSNVPALHSVTVKETLGNALNEIIPSLEFNDSTRGFVSGFTGKLLGESHFKYDEEYWKEMLTNPIYFSQGVKTLASEGCRTFVEISSHPSLLPLAMSNLAQDYAHLSQWIPTLRRDEDNWKTILNSLGKLFISGGNIQWDSLDVPGSRTTVDLPTYPFQRQKFWIFD